MHILPLATPLLHPGEDLAAILVASGRRLGGMRDGDIVAISSKAVAVCEDRMRDLTQISPSAEAKSLSKKCARSAEFCELMLEELARLNGKILGTAPGAALTELSPTGMRGSILVANAGLDESNVPPHHAVGWPEDPVRSVWTLRQRLLQELGKISKKQKDPTKPRKPKSPTKQTTVDSTRSSPSGIAVILTDSICIPRRLGVIAIALAASGIDPHLSLKGTTDLHHKILKITNEATADQLATAANFVMGNAGQSVPAAIIRDHGLPFSDFEGWVQGIAREHDLFGDMV